VSPDTKDRDAIGIRAIDNGVMTKNELSESGRPILNWASNLRKVTDPPERRQEDALVHIALAGAPLLLCVIQDVLKVPDRGGRDDDINT